LDIEQKYLEEELAALTDETSKCETTFAAKTDPTDQMTQAYHLLSTALNKHSLVITTAIEDIKKSGSSHTYKPRDEKRITELKKKAGL